MLCLFVTLLYLILFYFVWGFLGFVFVVFFGGGFGVFLFLLRTTFLLNHMPYCKLFVVSIG